MSNLGLYQVMTTWAKKVGGPKNLILLSIGSGYALFRSGEAMTKKIFKTIKKHVNPKSLDTAPTYTVSAYGKTEKDLELKIGDMYRVLATDGDAVLIEKLGDNNNPYFVSATFLQAISNFIS